MFIFCAFWELSKQRNKTASAGIQVLKTGRCCCSTNAAFAKRYSKRPKFGSLGLRSGVEGKSELLERCGATPNFSSGKRSGRGPDFYVNLGTVIETLRNDYLSMLETEIDYSVYDDDIILRDRVHGHFLQGKEAYRTVLWLLRVHTHIVFRQAFMDVKSMYYEDDTATIYLRWGIRAVPRLLPWDVNRQRYIDGLSIYRLNNNGWIQEHIVDNVLQTPIKLQSLVENILNLGTVRLRSPAGIGVQGGGSSQCGSSYENFLTSILRLWVKQEQKETEMEKHSIVSEDISRPNHMGEL
eukprot:jgi/Galph1/5531/GphlegSOOS_G4107.1